MWAREVWDSIPGTAFEVMFLKPQEAQEVMQWLEPWALKGPKFGFLASRARVILWLSLPYNTKSGQEEAQQYYTCTNLRVNFPHSMGNLLYKRSSETWTCAYVFLRLLLLLWEKQPTKYVSGCAHKDSELYHRNKNQNVHTPLITECYTGNPSDLGGGDLFHL